MSTFTEAGVVGLSKNHIPPGICDVFHGRNGCFTLGRAQEVVDPRHQRAGAQYCTSVHKTHPRGAGRQRTRQTEVTRSDRLSEGLCSTMHVFDAASVVDAAQGSLSVCSVLTSSSLALPASIIGAAPCVHIVRRVCARAREQMAQHDPTHLCQGWTGWCKCMRASGLDCFKLTSELGTSHPTCTTCANRTAITSANGMAWR